MLTYETRAATVIVQRVADQVARLAARVTRKTELRQGQIAAVSGTAVVVNIGTVDSPDLVDATTLSGLAVTVGDGVWMLWVQDGTWLVFTKT